MNLSRRLKFLDTIFVQKEDGSSFLGATEGVEADSFDILASVALVKNCVIEEMVGRENNDPTESSHESVTALWV